MSLPFLSHPLFRVEVVALFVLVGAAKNCRQYYYLHDNDLHDGRRLLKMFEISRQVALIAKKMHS